MENKMKEQKQTHGYGSIFKGIVKILGRDDLSPVMQHAYFDKGNIIATDPYHLVKIDLKFFGLDETAIEILEGKFLSKQVLTALSRINKKTLWSLTEQGFKVDNVVYGFSTNTGVYPNYNAFLPKKKEYEKIDTIGFNSKYLLNIQNIYHYQKGGDFGSCLKIIFNGKNRCILIKSIDTDYFTGLLMPEMLND